MTTHRSCFTTPAESSRWRSPRAGNPVLGPYRTGCDARPARGLLGKDVLGRIRDYIMAHLEEPIEVAKLAAIAGRSSFHFTRIFARTVGVTPHRYIVRLRLQCAIELIRDRQHGLAEIALRTGFSDQSHLTRWMQRVHGASLTQLVSR